MVHPEKKARAILMLKENFSKDVILKAWHEPIRQFVKKNRNLCVSESVAIKEIQNAQYPKLKRNDVYNFLSIPFQSQVLFNAFYKSLPKAYQQIWQFLTWNDAINGQDVKETYKVDVYDWDKIATASTYDLYKFKYGFKPFYQFFTCQSDEYRWTKEKQTNYNLSLPEKAQTFFQKYFPLPKNAELHLLDTIEKTDYLFEGETDILFEMPRLLAYRNQKQISTNKSGRPLASTLGKMQRKLNIKEFYPKDTRKRIKNFRTNLLAQLLVHTHGEITTTEIPAQVRQIIKRNYLSSFASSLALINYVKGMSYFTVYELKETESVFLSILNQLPLNKWVSFDNLSDFILLKGYQVKPISLSQAIDRIYIEEKIDKYYKEKTYIKKNNYRSHFIKPFIAATFFLFAAYGLVDIAYNEVEEYEEYEFSSDYQGLKYIRLNKLGAYVTSMGGKYEMPQSLTQSSIQLSKDSLTILIDENDTIAPVILEPYTQQVSANRFRTDYGFFLKGVKSNSDLESKIKLFKQSIKTDLPHNWTAFFTDLRKKVNPLQRKDTVKVFEIPTDNKELLRLIAKDRLLQKLCFKAEGYQIIIKDKDYNRFKKRLQEFGYLLT